MKKIVVFTGAGVSAESGIKTFRDTGGLWEEYSIREVATPEAWYRNPKLVLDFYNKRRKQILEAKPNPAHFAIKELEKRFKVEVITQNIDDLHERAGSKHVLHLHGEIIKSQSSIDSDLVYPIKNREINWGELCEKGSQLRPHVVWFGEAVPNMEIAEEMVSECNIFIIVGTSLNVYPAANLIDLVRPETETYLIDPGVPNIGESKNLIIIKEKAGVGVPMLVKELLEI